MLPLTPFNSVYVLETTPTPTAQVEIQPSCYALAKECPERLCDGFLRRARVVEDRAAWVARV